jgi:hypothetical protein
LSAMGVSCANNETAFIKKTSERAFTKLYAGVNKQYKRLNNFQIFLGRGIYKNNTYYTHKATTLKTITYNDNFYTYILYHYCENLSSIHVISIFTKIKQEHT